MKGYQFWVDKLKLLSHPEGGYYKETYRSTDKFIGGDQSFPSGRTFSTGIYFLLHDDNFSAFHRIKSDEMWHFYEGTGLTVYIITESGKLDQIKLGSDPDRGEVFQAIVPAGCWFASKTTGENSYALVGCTVAPGFDFEDFEMANRQDLLKDFPELETEIVALTRV